MDPTCKQCLTWETLIRAAKETKWFIPIFSAILLFLGGAIFVLVHALHEAVAVDVYGLDVAFYRIGLTLAILCSFVCLFLIVLTWWRTPRDPLSCYYLGIDRGGDLHIHWEAPEFDQTLRRFIWDDKREQIGITVIEGYVVRLYIGLWGKMEMVADSFRPKVFHKTPRSRIVNARIHTRWLILGIENGLLKIGFDNSAETFCTDPASALRLMNEFHPIGGEGGGVIHQVDKLVRGVRGTMGMIRAWKDSSKSKVGSAALNSLQILLNSPPPPD